LLISLRPYCHFREVKQRDEIAWIPDKARLPILNDSLKENHMKLNTLARISLAAILTTLPGALPAQDKVAVQQVAVEKESVELIDQIEDVARSVHNNTDALRMHASRNLSRYSHQHHLSEIAELINNGLNPALNRLNEIKPGLPEWQQHAVDRILESARSLSNDSNSAFLSLKDNGAKPIHMNTEFRAFLDTMDQHAENLVSTADVAGDYANALDQALEAGLKVPSHR